MELITIKTPEEIEKMRAAGRLTARARALAGSMIRPGVTTGEMTGRSTSLSAVTAPSLPS